MIYGLFLLMLMAFTYVYYTDHQSEQTVYNFCKSYAVGNSIQDLTSAVPNSQLTLQPINTTSLLLIKESLMPLVKTSGCEVHHEQGKITQLFFVKQ